MFKRLRSKSRALVTGATAVALVLGSAAMPVIASTTTQPAAALASTRAVATTGPAATAPADDSLGDLGGVGGSGGPTTQPGGEEESPELLLYKDMPIVVAAAKRVQTTSEAAASVSVITAQDIQQFGYRSLADALRTQRGFYMVSDGLNWFAGVRGFLRPGEWNARLLILVDGRPTNEDIYGQTHLDLDFTVPMEAIERIEVIRGPGSALYGSNAVFGVINIVTKKGADVDGVETTLTGGTQDTAQANILFGKKFANGWDVIGDFNGYSSQGDTAIHYDGVTDPAHNYGNIDGFDEERAWAGFVKAQSGELTLEGDFASREKGNRSATYLTSFFDPGNMYEDRHNFTAKVDHEISPTQSIHAMVYYGYYKYDQAFEYAPSDGVPAYKYTTTASDAWVGEDIHYEWQATKDFHLLLGSDGNQAVQARQNDYDSLQGTVLNVPSSYNSWSLYTEGEDKVTKWLDLTAGIRMDKVQRIGTNTSPRFAAILKPTNADTIKLLYGKAFREPNLYELLYFSPGSNTPNPDLKPEIVDTYEVDWERQFHDNWQTTLGGYLWKMKDSMDDIVLPDGSVQTQNTGTVWAHGIEGEIDKKWDTGASFRAYGSYTDAAKGGNQLTLSPHYIFGTSLAFPIWRKNTFLAIEPQVVGPMKSDLGQSTQPTYLTNVVLTSKDILKDWTFQVGAYGLFAHNARMPHDASFEQYQPTLNYPSTQYLFSATYRF
jgi:outer membrane receptor protein involved in Fe transport